MARACRRPAFERHAIGDTFGCDFSHLNFEVRAEKQAHRTGAVIFAKGLFLSSQTRDLRSPRLSTWYDEWSAIGSASSRRRYTGVRQRQDGLADGSVRYYRYPRPQPPLRVKSTH
jgi:hypothetical protein